MADSKQHEADTHPMSDSIAEPEQTYRLKINSLTQENTQLSGLLEELRARVAELEDQLAESGNEVQGLTQELEQLNTKIAKWLHMGKVPEVTSCPPPPSTPWPYAIHHAASENNLCEVKRLLDANVSPTLQRAADGASPVYLAASQGHTELVELLLAAGGCPNDTVLGGVTPLCIAAQSGNAGVVQVLLDAKSDPDRVTDWGATALMSVAPRDLESSQSIVERLLLAKASPDLADNQGVTPLMLAAEHGRPRTVKALLRANADVNRARPQGPEVDADTVGATALLLAAQGGHAETVFHLVREKADPGMTCQNGDTALCRAAHKCSDKVVSMLLAAKAAPEQLGALGATPLCVAASQSRGAGVVHALLLAKADPQKVITARNGTCWTAVELAKARGSGGIVRLLQDGATAPKQEKTEGVDVSAVSADVSSSGNCQACVVC
eukprot:TRINITY_DN4890_c0_g1_i1.p1 TRINITY_DN4890_c0_g1~~TRINITY_DN4890_c0_g1_i1.p1  ORF type:complete len:439 (-),score=101.37 TRINITY_DN4890_c0_g1_i1:168-1484(-)